MDCSSKEAKKILKDYYYWRVLYRDRETRERIKLYFGYEDPTPSLLETPTYVAAQLTVDLDRGLLYTHNWQSNKELPLPGFGTVSGKHIKTPIEFYTYTDEFIKNAPADYEAILKDYIEK